MNAVLDYRSWLYTLSHTELVSLALDNDLDPEDYLTDEDMIEAIATSLEDY